ncbi:MAG: hypothetical protein ACK4RN_05065 [Pseudorhodobacter sp.]
MPHVVNTAQLIREGVLTEAQGAVIAARSRSAMIALAVNSLLSAGILAAALGFVFWLADPFAVAVVGALFLVLGAMVLLRGSAEMSMLGNAAALIGAGMLGAGAAIEIVDKLPRELGGGFLLLLGAGLGAGALKVLRSGPEPAHFVSGAVLLIGLALHLTGLALWVEAAGPGRLVIPLASLYATALLVAAGTAIDVRLVTALAIVPFAQMLNTGTAYWHAVYAFYSPEPTLSILQMGALLAACFWAAARFGERIARHAGMLGIMAFVVGNLCFLVGSLWGDVIGESWANVSYDHYRTADGSYDWEAADAARRAYMDAALVIPRWVFATLWAGLLAAGSFWAAHRGHRGLFNATLTFGAIHGYTQAFESFGQEPLAYVVGGLAAIPLAWGAWRLNARFEDHSPA